MNPFDLGPGHPVVLYLREPKEKIWGLLVSISAPGIVVRGIDIAVFDDWMRQEARGEEPLIGLVTSFYPMHRLERMEHDETVGPLLSYADRFSEEVGKTVLVATGFLTTGAKEPA
jgi:hypothetical protein